MIISPILMIVFLSVLTITLIHVYTLVKIFMRTYVNLFVSFDIQPIKLIYRVRRRFRGLSQFSVGL